RLKAASCQDTSTCLDTLVFHISGNKSPIANFKAIDWRVVADLYSQIFGASVVSIDKRLAAAHEKGVRARHMQCTGQWRLKMNAMLAHPPPAGRGCANNQPSQFFVGLPAGHGKQITPILFLGVSVYQYVLRCIVHAA